MPARTMHINQTPEWFYQYERSHRCSRWSTRGEFRDIIIREGRQMFLLPGDTPHNPVRFADTVGVVLEQKRPEGLDRSHEMVLRRTAEVVHEAAFHRTDLGTQIKAAVEALQGERRRRGSAGIVGELADWCPKPGSIKDPRHRVGQASKTRRKHVSYESNMYRIYKP